MRPNKARERRPDAPKKTRRRRYDAHALADGAGDVPPSTEDVAKLKHALVRLEDGLAAVQLPARGEGEGAGVTRPGSFMFEARARRARRARRRRAPRRASPRARALHRTCITLPSLLLLSY